MEKLRADRLTPATLAFIGDAVHTLYIREAVVDAGDVGRTLHIAASGYVNAKAQAAAFDALSSRGVFTAEEAEIARRAKNAHLHSRAKTATSDDYHRATALEAVIGYVHLTGNAERERELLALTVSVLGEEC